MDGACSTHVKDEKFTQIGKKPEWKRPPEDLDVDKNII